MAKGVEEAEGYIGLGMFRDAWEVLDRMPTGLQLTSPVLRCRARCFIAFKSWTRGEAVARMLGTGDEEDRRIAATFFHEGAVWHAGNTGFPFAHQWVCEAIRLNPQQRILILEDPRFPDGFL